MDNLLMKEVFDIWTNYYYANRSKILEFMKF